MKIIGNVKKKSWKVIKLTDENGKFVGVFGREWDLDYFKNINNISDTHCSDAVKPWIFEGAIQVMTSSRNVVWVKEVESGFPIRMYPDGLALMMEGLQDGWLDCGDMTISGTFQIGKKSTNVCLVPVKP